MSNWTNLERIRFELDLFKPFLTIFKRFQTAQEGVLAQGEILDRWIYQF